MHIEELSSWTQFKDLCITKKNLHVQRVTTDNANILLGPDSDTILWRYVSPITDPASAEQTEIESMDADFNWAIPTRAHPFATGDFDFAPKAAIDTCTAGGTKVVLIPVCGTKYMNGGSLITNGNAAFGDWIKVEVVDHDNLLGYGVDFVLKTWIEKWYVDIKSCKDFVQTPYAGLPPAGMYLRLTYNSVGATDVGFALNLLMHKTI